MKKSFPSIRKAVIPVGGLGTRFLPATKAMPKEMLPIVDKPLIQYALEEAMDAGIEHFIFITGRGKMALEDHFDRAPELEYVLKQKGQVEILEALQSWQPKSGQISYIRQNEPLGLGHAVLCAKDSVGNEPFAVMLPDDLIYGKKPCLRQMVDAYAKTGGHLLAVQNVSEEHVSRYGVLDIEKDDGFLVKAKGIVEKPKRGTAPSTLCVIGRYILDPMIFKALEKREKGTGGEIQLTDSIARTMGDAGLWGMRFEGRRYDCGDKVDFLVANIEMALERKDLSTRFKEALSESPYFKQISFE